MTRPDGIDAELAEAVAFVRKHHAITTHLNLADVVIGCACTPAVERDSAEWATHLLAEILALGIGELESLERHIASDALAPVGHGPVEEAGPCRVIPINRTTK